MDVNELQLDPILAQGAGIAIEDAVHLYEALSALSPEDIRTSSHLTVALQQLSEKR